MDFSEAMKEWIALKLTLSAARQDLSSLNKREKELKVYITKHMSENDIDTVKIKDTVKVNLKKKISKGSITKQVIRTGLMNFFNSDGARVDQAIEAIEAAQPTKDVSSVSVTGLKK
jgi:DNA polymerase II small subunit/DNA polymerase delta subunit B